jgi:hypothetical protein
MPFVHPIPEQKLSLLTLTLLLLIARPSPAQQKLDLRLHFTKDDVRTMTVTLEQTVDQTTLQTKPDRLTQKLTLGYTIKVEDVDDRGQATVSLRYDSEAYHSTSGSTTIDYDSTQPAAVEPPVAAALAALVGQSYSFTVSPEGQVTRVTGLDKLANTVIAKLAGVEGPARLAAERILRQQLSEPSVKASLQNLFAPFPDHPVAVGESWAHNIQLNTGFNLALDTTCTFKSRDNGIATIEISGHFATPGSVFMELNQTRFSYDFRGDTRGQIQIQESTGWTISSAATQSLAGAATTASPNVAPQSIPLKVESTLKALSK